MQISVEYRCFWIGECPEDIRSWFFGGGATPGGGGCRTDRYFHEPGNVELGIKVRDETAGQKKPTIEIKGLLAELTPPAIQGARAAQLWCKWRSAFAPHAPGLVLEKTRWLRKFDASGGGREIPLDAAERPRSGGALPASGCNLELTKVVVIESGCVWWTIGFEAFGNLETAPVALAEVMRAVQPPSLSGGLELSYPAWLDNLPAQWP